MLSLLAVTMLTACGNNDEPVNKRTYSVAINNRIVDGDNVVFSQNASSIEIDFTDMTIQISSGYKDADGTSHTLITPAMKLTNTGGLIYHFNSSSSTTPIAGIDGTIDGYIDLSTITALYSFTTSDNDMVYSATQLIYSYVHTTITNPENNNNKIIDFSQYKFIINATGDKCTMLTTNFAPNLNGSIQATQVYWEDLKLEPTATGYIVTASVAASSMKGYYDITDLHITLDNHGHALNGEFKCGGLNFNLAGDMFPATLFTPRHQ